MRVYRATKSGKRPLASHGLLDDDTVAAAAAKLRRLLGSPVYMWCYRQVDAHEALAIAVAGGIHETGGKYDPAVAVRELERRMSIRVTAAAASTPAKLLASLRRRDESELREPVPMRNRFVVPGGYFSGDGVDPYADPRSDGGSGEGRARPFNTGDLLLEAFDADAVYVTAKSDLEAARPAGVGEKAWRDGFVSRFVPDVEDRDLFKWSEEGERQLRDQRRSPPPAEPPIITYLPMTGGAPVGSVGVDALMNAFATVAATRARPVVRLQGGGIDRPVARVHESFSDEELAKVRAPNKREWLQVVFAGGKGGAHLTVYPTGAYKLQVRFGYLEKATVEDAVAYFGPVNALLAAVSPMIRPLSPRHLRPSSSLYIQKPQLLETPSVLGGPRNGVYQIATVRLPARCELRDVSAVVGARGFPSLRGVNTHAGEFHMQWVRSSALRKAAVVKNLLYHSSTNGGLSAADAERLAADLGLTRRELADIADAKFNRHTAMTLVKVRVASDEALTVHVNGNDPAYGARVQQALANLLRECGRGRKRGATDWSGSVSESPEAMDAGITSASDLDEFYEFFDDEGGDFDDGWEGPAPGAPDAAEEGAQGAVEVRQKGNILERLKQADPEVFAFPSQPGYVPYSMKCQKNKNSTKQPLVLTREEAARAARGSSSSGRGRETMRGALEYRGLTYVCPEKWCPVSGVARGLAEPCPDPDEPEWTMWSNNHPALQAGVAHPQGLCMPCCFGSKPKRGLKTWNVIKKCKDEAGEEMPDGGEEEEEEGQEEQGRDGRSRRRPPRVKTGHVNKADKLLEEGGLGRVPDDVFPDGTGKGLFNAVRRGMGDRSKATLARAAALVLGYESGAALLRALASSLRPQHFIQGDVREFMVDGDARAAAKTSETRVREWMPREYSRALSIKQSALTAGQVVREARVMLAHEECVRRLRAGGEGVSDTSLFRFVNSGALSKRPVLLVHLDEAGNASAEHLPESAMPAAGKVAVILKRRGIYEPIGFKGKGGFDPWWDAAGEWPQRVFRAVRVVTPPGRKRVVSYSMMAVGAVAESGYLPFSRPVFVDPAFDHEHIADGRLPGPASAAAADAAFEQTGDAFYRFAWRDVARAAAADDERDANLILPAVEDERARTMARLGAKMEAAKRAAAEMIDGVDPSVFAAREGETARGRVRRARREAKRAAGVDAPDDVLDFAAETLFRPVPPGVPPSVKPGKGERISHVSG
eukprot:jgi/Tetstr1/464177/TSEL_008982.t1